jgi:ribosomal protein S18 acetylase RimI-like enzyme
MKSDIHIINLQKTELSQKELAVFLNKISKDFFPPLENRVDINLWSKKLYAKSTTLVICAPENKKQIVGAVSFYSNNYADSISYITLLGVHPAYRRRGYGKKLLNACLMYLTNKGFKSAQTRTWFGNDAVSLYKSFGFIETKRAKDRPDGGESIFFEKKL